MIIFKPAAIAIFGIAAASMMAAPVAALPGAGVTQVDAPPLIERVSYADLDLTSAAGKIQLKKRIREAVAHVCPAPSFVSAQETMVSRKCRGSATFSALRQMNQAIASSERGSAIATALIIGPDR